MDESNGDLGIKIKALLALKLNFLVIGEPGCKCRRTVKQFA